MSDEHQVPRRRWPNTPIGAWVLLATALIQAASPSLAGFDQGADDDPVVVPPGPFFAVWGVVVLGCLLVAVCGLKRDRAIAPAFRRLHVPLSITQTGFVLWLLLAAAVPVLTVPVFGLMLAMLVVALRRAPDVHGTGGGLAKDTVLVESVLGVYAGWSAAAVWINVASVTSRPPIPLLAALLAAAVVSEITLVTAVCRTFPARVAAGATGIWALLGVALSTFSTGAGALGALAVAGIGALAVATVATTRRPPARRRPSTA
ncbi:hypothetical protein [Catenuloplanes indicus]|uniref:Uncharacterized protein n=1 Tax=Catenuloplanes indicus TaxID=137267 RepID=A0AAE4AVD4_9ACTN|nr:hypothetical protein [Catenuloplanes indicus]MDQ0363616.1 hypothetical protein [Catenuloplanes indicus]